MGIYDDQVGADTFPAALSSGGPLAKALQWLVGPGGGLSGMLGMSPAREVAGQVDLTEELARQMGRGGDTTGQQQHVAPGIPEGASIPPQIPMSVQDAISGMWARERAAAPFVGREQELFDALMRARELYQRQI